MTVGTAADFAAAHTNLRLVLGDDGTLSVDPTTSRAFTQLVAGCEPSISEVLLLERYMKREILRRCQLAGLTGYDYGKSVLRVLVAEPAAEHLAWSLLLRWGSVTIVDVSGEVIGFAGAVDG